MKRLVAILVCAIMIALPSLAIADEKEKKPVIPDTIVGAEALAAPHYIWDFKPSEEKEGDKNAIDRLVKDEAVTPQTADRIKEVADQKVKP